MSDLDSCDRAEGIRARIQNKKSLCKLYHEFYGRYLDCLSKCSDSGLSVEIGSGAGLMKETISDVVTTDILSYKTVDMVMDACSMPFRDNSIKSFFLLNTLHHIPDTVSFFNEVERCLKPGGRVLIIDQYHGWLSSMIYNYIHHEPYDPQAVKWKFETSGPLSGANGALCWIIFFRDRSLFEKSYPSLKIVGVTPNTPFRYWISGGLKWWSLLPKSLFGTATRIDDWLSRNFPSMSSVVDIELVKQIR